MGLGIGILDMARRFMGVFWVSKQEGAFVILLLDTKVDLFFTHILTSSSIPCVVLCKILPVHPRHEWQEGLCRSWPMIVIEGCRLVEALLRGGGQPRSWELFK